MSEIVDTISIKYDDIEELLERKAFMEKLMIDYMDDKPNVANRYESEIITTSSKTILSFILYKD